MRKKGHMPVFGIWPFVCQRNPFPADAAALRRRCEADTKEPLLLRIIEEQRVIITAKEKHRLSDQGTHFLRQFGG